MGEVWDVVGGAERARGALGGVGRRVSTLEGGTRGGGVERHGEREEIESDRVER